MTDETGPRSIYEALSQAKARIGPIPKSDRNKEQQYAFRGIDSILNTAGPVLTDLGIVTSPVHRLISSEEVTSSRGTPGYRILIESTWTFSVHVDRQDGRFPEHSSVTAQTLGEAIDYSDKGVNKAQTQSFKNALAQVLAIPTGEPDPDHENPERASAARPGPVKTTAEEVLEALRFEGLSMDDAKEYAKLAREALEIPHPIPGDKVPEIVSMAVDLWKADLDQLDDDRDSMLAPGGYE